MNIAPRDTIRQIDGGQRLGGQLADQEPQRIGRGLAGIDPAGKRRHQRWEVSGGLAVKGDLVHAHPPRGKA
jgi:hypothetical protein